VSHLNPVEARLCLEALPSREQQLVEHLLGCPQCRTALDRKLARTPSEDWRYDQALQTAFERAAEVTRQAEPRVLEERAAAHRLLDDLWALRPDHWPAFFLRSLSPAFLLLALDTAARAATRDPNTAETMARHVRAAAGRRKEELPETLGAELMTRAWAVAGRARAARQEWAAADAAFEEASRGLADFPNLAAEAELCRFQAAAFAARGRFAEAAALLARAALLAGAAVQSGDEICDLSELAQLCSRRGDLDQAAGLLARALLRADHAGLDVSAAQLRLRLAWTLRQLGQLAEAQRVALPSAGAALGGDEEPDDDVH
jgi:tetratricopeptide (TPR) repeat protein